MQYPFIAAAFHRPRKPGFPLDRIIIHTMEGSYRGTIAWFKNRDRSAPSSAHYCVSREGEITQMVAEDHAAFHAGSKTERGWNDRSIGIELEAVTGARGPTMRWPPHDFPQPMMDVLVSLVKGIAARHGIPMDREHIIGHHEVPGATHTDPGPHFPWDAFMFALGVAS